MTKLEEFISFAKALPENRQFLLDEVLSSLMATLDTSNEFTSKELAEIDRRLAVKDPQFATEKDIQNVFGQSFN